MPDALLKVPIVGQAQGFAGKPMNLRAALGSTVAPHGSETRALRQRHDLPDLSRGTLTDLLDGLIRYEQNEIAKLRRGLPLNKAVAGGGEVAIVLKNTVRLASDAAEGAFSLVEHAGGRLLASHVHRHPLFRTFLDSHLPHSTVATKQAIETALFKGTLKGGLVIGALLLAPEVALTGFLVGQLCDAVFEYALVVRGKQEGQDAGHILHSRSGRLAFYRRLRCTLAMNGRLTAEQVHRIIERQNERLLILR